MSIDVNSETWHTIKREALAKIEELRGALEGEWDEATTAKLRGEIRAYRIVLGLSGNGTDDTIRIGDPSHAFQPKD